ncbi:MAG: hypothetical protein D6B25_08130 [Desulfobulbaceae bacterium]|nr:MAG: hypothetical protein D6B25_08130 [Desulfobulbaceae bacterium]
MGVLIRLMIVSVILFWTNTCLAYQWYCNGMQLENHTFSKGVNNYTVSWRCESYGENSHEIHNLKFYGSYNPSNGHASESVDDHFLYYHKGEKKNDIHYSYQVRTTCSNDPWVYDTVCSKNQYSVTPVFPKNYGIPYTSPNPKGSMLAASIKQGLQQEYETFLVAPSILLPQNGEKYEFGKNIPILVSHNPDFTPRFKIEWRKDSQSALKQVTSSIIFNIQTTNGVTTAKMHPLEKGEWTVRAQTENTSFWSEPRTFKVIAPIDSTPEVIPTHLQQLKKPVFHDPRVNHTYSSSEAIPLRIGFQQGAILKFQMGVRGLGEPSFVMFPEGSTSAPNGFLETKIPGLFGAYTAEDVSEIIIKAWVERPEGGEQYLVNKSETNERIIRVVGGELTITHPEQNRNFIAPARLTYTVQLPQGMNFTELSLDHWFQYEFQHAEISEGGPAVFVTDDSEPDKGLVGNIATFAFNLTEPKIYRFRIRAIMPSPVASPVMNGKWTDWRRVKVGTLIGSLKERPNPMEIITVSGAENSSNLSVDSQLHHTPEKQIGPNIPQIQKVPIFVQPTPNKKYKSGDLIKLDLQLVGKDQSVQWHIEYRPFSAKRFSKVSDKMIGRGMSRSGDRMSARLITQKPGEYRIKTKFDLEKARWSQWRYFQIGEPVSVNRISTIKPVKPSIQQKTSPGKLTPNLPSKIKPTEKPKPALNETVRPSTTLSPTSKLPQNVSSE